MEFPEIFTLGSTIQFLLLFIIFYIYFKKKSKNNPYRKYYLLSYVLHVVVTPLYLLYHKYIQKTGDMFGYFNDSVMLKDIGLHDMRTYLRILFTSVEKPGPYDNIYMASQTLRGDDEAFISKLGSIVQFFTFDSILNVSFIFSVIAFLGCWKLFKIFTKIYPYKARQIAIFCLFFPSLVFWGSCISKDSVCIGALGYMTYSFFQLFVYKEDKLKNFFILMCCILIYLNVKIYILLSFVVAFSLYYYLHIMGQIKQAVLRVSIFIGLTIIVYFVAGKFLNYMEEAALEFSIDNISKTIVNNYTYLAKDAGAGSAYDIGKIEPTFAGVISKFPVSVNLVFFRPYVWEIKNPAMLLTAIESGFVFLFTLYIVLSVGIRKFFSRLISNRTILFLIIFSIIFAFFIGISSGNYGTLQRYKIPIIPYYFVALIMIRYGKPHREKELDLEKKV